MAYAPAMPIVLVEWIDSNMANGWHSVDEMTATVTQGQGCQSVGYLFADLPDRVVLVGHVAETGQVGDAMTIPRVAIVSVTTLREVGT